MLDKFSRKDLGPFKQLKVSQARHVRGELAALYPSLPLDTLLDPSQPLFQAVCKIDKSSVLINNGRICFFQTHDTFVPSLHIAAQYPACMRSVQVDAGAIRHILTGSDVMGPGLTSTGGRLLDDLEPGDAVLVMAEGKTLPVALCFAVRSAADIRASSKGVALETHQFLGDGVWRDAVAPAK